MDISIMLMLIVIQFLLVYLFHIKYQYKFIYSLNSQWYNNISTNKLDALKMVQSLL